MGTRICDRQEKQAHVEEFKRSEEPLARYALENGIPETTLRGWLKENKELKFGAIEINSSNPPLPRISESPIVFATENIRIELKENFDKALLRQIVEALINVKLFTK